MESPIYVGANLIFPTQTEIDNVKLKQMSNLYIEGCITKQIYLYLSLSVKINYNDSIAQDMFITQ